MLEAQVYACFTVSYVHMSWTFWWSGTSCCEHLLIEVLHRRDCSRHTRLSGCALGQVLKALLGEDAAVQVLLGADPNTVNGMSSSITSSPGTTTRVMNYPRTKTINSAALDVRLPQQRVGVARNGAGSGGGVHGGAHGGDQVATHTGHKSPRPQTAVTQDAAPCHVGRSSARDGARDAERDADSGIVSFANRLDPPASDDGLDDTAADDASDALQTTDITCRHIPDAAITLFECLGSGAFGIVYRARVDPGVVAATVGTTGAPVGAKCGAEDSGVAPSVAGADWADLPVEVAVKKLHGGGNHARHIEQLCSEAVLVASVPVHENVARLLAVCMDTASPALVLELYDGGDVHTAMYGDGRSNGTQSSRVTHPGAVRACCILCLCKQSMLHLLSVQVEHVASVVCASRACCTCCQRCKMCSTDRVDECATRVLWRTMVTCAVCEFVT